MNTIKESALNKNKDLSYVRGLDTAGNPIQIAKEDIIELFRANIPIASTLLKGLMSADGFMDRGQVVNVSDALKSGMYWHGSSLSDVPGSSYGILIVFRLTTGYTVQIDITLSSLNILIRALRISPSTGDIIIDQDWKKIIIGS